MAFKTVLRWWYPIIIVFYFKILYKFLYYNFSTPEHTLGALCLLFGFQWSREQSTAIEKVLDSRFSGGIIYFISFSVYASLICLTFAMILLYTLFMVNEIYIDYVNFIVFHRVHVSERDDLKWILTKCIVYSSHNHDFAW